MSRFERLTQKIVTNNHRLARSPSLTSDKESKDGRCNQANNSRQEPQLSIFHKAVADVIKSVFRIHEMWLDSNR